MSKSELRRSFLKARRDIPLKDVSGLSISIQQNLQSQPEFARARVLASYAAKADEVQTSSIVEEALRSGKRVVYPLVDDQSGELLFFEVRSPADLSMGGFGVSEPARHEKAVRLSETDAVLVPLVAWDAEGHRIGYGKGYFDRALVSRGSSVAIGLGFESQLVPRIPVAGSDVPLDMVVTEKRVLRFKKNTKG